MLRSLRSGKIQIFKEKEKQGGKTREQIWNQKMMDELVFCLYYPLKLTAINFFSMHHFLFLNSFHPCIMLFQYCFHSDQGLKGFPQQRTINISKTTGSCSTPTT